MNPQTGLRKRIQIDNENFYITVTPTSVTATIPRKNRSENMKLRQIVDALTDTITETLEELADVQPIQEGE
jgi:hypothetical protein